MTPENFDERVRELKGMTLPVCPPGLDAAVLRRVRDAQRSHHESVWEVLGHWIARPGFAAAALLAVMFMTAASSALAVRLNRPNDQSIARAALGFDTIATTSALDLDHHP